MKNQLTELIVKGQTFKFDTNSVYKGDEYRSKASTDLLRWVVKVKKLIDTECDENSTPHFLSDSFQIKYLNGYPEWYFNLELSILNQALKSCADMNQQRTPPPMMAIRCA